MMSGVGSPSLPAVQSCALQPVQRCSCSSKPSITIPAVSAGRTSSSSFEPQGQGFRQTCRAHLPGRALVIVGDPEVTQGATVCVE
jgi:hypothetical protein